MRSLPFIPTSKTPEAERTGWLGAWNYAHRGLHGRGPDGAKRVENTRSAFSAAIAAGCGIECDIQRSADDVPMVFHDWDFKRLIGRPDRAEALTAAEWRKLSYLEHEEAPIALSDLLELVAGQVPLLIEIKSKAGYDVKTTCLKVRDVLEGYQGHHGVMSFDPRVSRWLRRRSPETLRGLVIREDEHGYTQQAWQRRLALWVAQPEFMAYHIDALPNPWVAGLRANGLPVTTWTVKNDAERARAAACADAPIFEGNIPEPRTV